MNAAVNSQESNYGVRSSGPEGSLILKNLDFFEKPPKLKRSKNSKLFKNKYSAEPGPYARWPQLFFLRRKGY